MGINDAKKAAKESLHLEKLSTLTISVSDLSSGIISFTAPNEILYNGRLYDVASQTKEGGNITLKVLHDEKEEGLLSELSEIMEDWLIPTSNNNKNTYSKQIAETDFVPASKFTFHFYTQISEITSISTTHFTQSPLISVLKSPPRFS